MRSSSHFFTKKRMLVAKPIRNAAYEASTIGTWMNKNGLCSDGTSGSSPLFHWRANDSRASPIARTIGPANQILKRAPKMRKNSTAQKTTSDNEPYKSFHAECCGL